MYWSFEVWLVGVVFGLFMWARFDGTFTTTLIDRRRGVDVPEFRIVQQGPSQTQRRCLWVCFHFLVEFGSSMLSGYDRISLHHRYGRLYDSIPWTNFLRYPNTRITQDRSDYLRTSMYYFGSARRLTFPLMIPYSPSHGPLYALRTGTLAGKLTSSICFCRSASASRIPLPFPLVTTQKALCKPILNTALKAIRQ
jgi:hypothetical protein